MSIFLTEGVERDNVIDTSHLLEQVRAGRFPAGIYSDPDLHAAEREHLFSRAWQFLAHESEIPKPGDFVVRHILDDSFIVARDDTGAVRVLLNQCRHRGMQVCRAEAGHATFFRCPYHAWTYRNTGELVSVPFHREAYGGDDGLVLAQSGLVAPPRVESYHGLIFANLDRGAIGLEQSLGDMRFFLDLYIRQSAAGAELYGPQRWRVRCNWKIGAENFGGDSYHTPHTHTSVVEIGLFSEPRAQNRMRGALYLAGGGSGTTYKLPGRDFDANLAYLGYPPEMRQRMQEAWTPAQQELAGPAGFMVSAATIYPNLSLVHNWPIVSPEGPLTPFISLRLWQPISATEMEAWSWFVVDRNAPDWYKQESRRAYLACFGTSGMFEQDDMENWTSITAVAKGYLGARQQLDSTMGMSPGGGSLHEPVADWPGPGRAFVGFGEYGQRAFLTYWADHLVPASPPTGVA
ncbi:MAG: aromatic ring-hydroxylating dioxygenase subunit alpha [Acidimicrobiaceae bacterium]|nr:aromatic ring-hydroxylating dioxygenase subunit alpha [Acidimicrobiaceae bacterium]